MCIHIFLSKCPTFLYCLILCLLPFNSASSVFRSCYLDTFLATLVLLGLSKSLQFSSATTTFYFLHNFFNAPWLCISSHLQFPSVNYGNTFILLSPCVHYILLNSSLIFFVFLIYNGVFKLFQLQFYSDYFWTWGGSSKKYFLAIYALSITMMNFLSEIHGIRWLYGQIITVNSVPVVKEFLSGSGHIQLCICVG